MKKEKLKNVGAGLVSTQKGITLVALVITIIVLLILAGVTINLTLGQNGIFKTAEQAAKNYKEAENKELGEIGSFEEEMNDVIAEAQSIKAKGITLSKTSTSIGVTGGETLTVTVTPGNATNKSVKWTTSDESIATVEDGTITAKGVGTATITATAQDGSGVSARCTVTVNPVQLSTIAKAGDYVKYDSGTNGVITCRVLYPASSEYGLQIISDKNVKKVTLGSYNYSKAVTAYNSAIETLNNEAEGYVNSNYAYDGRCVGSAPTVEQGMFVDKDKVKFEGTTEYVVPGATNYVTPQFTNESYINSFGTDINYKTDQTQMITAGLWTTGEVYWLASRVVYSYSSTCDFFVRRVSTSGGEGGGALSYVDSSDYTQGSSSENGLRPCISLKSDIIKITGGTGADADNAYIIGK